MKVKRIDEDYFELEGPVLYALTRLRRRNTQCSGRCRGERFRPDSRLFFLSHNAHGPGRRGGDLDPRLVEGI